MYSAANDPEPELYKAVYDLLQRTFQEVKDDLGRGYNPSRSYQSLYRNGSREAVQRSVLKRTTQGFGRLDEARRLDLSYEWFVLNPKWQFSEEVRQRAWQKLDATELGALSTSW
jgi:lysyl-tRNA synthetase class I